MGLDLETARGALAILSGEYEDAQGNVAAALAAVEKAELELAEHFERKGSLQRVGAEGFS